MSAENTQAVAPARSEIERFLAMVYASTDAQLRVARVGNHARDIAAFAGHEGFVFSGGEFAAYVAEQLEARLPDEQKRARADALRRGGVAIVERADPARVGIFAAANGDVLDRSRLLAGDIVIVTGSSTFAAIAQRIRDALTAALGDPDPMTAHVRLDEETCHERVQRMDQALADDPAMPRLIADFARSLGWPTRGVGYFGPFVRHNLPQGEHDVGGYFSKVRVRYTSRLGARAGGPTLLNAHRDTWFGAPFHQVNVWAPLYPYPPGSGVVMVPDKFATAIRNNTPGYDIWRAQLGLAVGPMCLEQIEPERLVPVDLDVGQLMVFSANHFHGTGSNTGAVARISMELRMVCERDRDAGLGAPNVDFHGLGELATFNCIPFD